jgi:hypothetical protein
MGDKFLVGVSRDVITADGGTMFGAEAMKILDHPAVTWEFLPEKVAEKSKEGILFWRI